MPVVQYMTGEFDPAEFDPTEFLTTSGLLEIPQPGTRWVWMLTMYLAVLGTRKHANFFAPEVTDYYPNLSSERLPRFTRALPSPLSGFQERREVEVAMSSIPSEADGATEGLTIPQIVLAEDPLGQRGVAQCYDLVTGTDVMRLDGPMFAYDEGEEISTIAIHADDESAMQTDISKIATRDKFPSADLSTVRQGQDHTPQIAFGPTPQADLALLVANYLALSFTLVTIADNYRYEDLTNITDYTVAAGDALVYDVLHLTDNALIAMDLECSDTTTLRASGAVDQNNQSAHPNTDLQAFARNSWYRREIPLPASMNGKTITKYMLACEQNAAGTYLGCIANAVIVDTNGSIRKYIFNQDTSTPTFSTTRNGSGSNAFAGSKSAVWQYGPIRGTATAETVYRSESVVSVSEYTVVSTGLTVGGVALNAVEFTRDQRDTSGQLEAITADLTCSEFGRNPATALAFVLSDPTFGLGQPINALSFSAAATAYITLGYDKLANGLLFKRSAFEVVQKLCLHGAMLERNTDNEYILTVDTAALHTTVTGTDGVAFAIGRGDDRGLNNVTLLDPPRSASLDDRVRKVIYHGYSHPKYGWLIQTTRSRVVAGGREETIENEFIGGSTMLDTEAHYKLEMLKLLDRPVSAQLMQEAYILDLNHLTTLYAPHSKYSGQQMMVRGKTMQGNAVELLLAPYSANPYSYVVGDSIRVDPHALTLTDYSHTVPAAPTGFVAPTYITKQNDQGITSTYAKFTGVVAPAVNCDTIIFEAIVDGETLPSVHSPPLPIAPGQTGIEAELKVEPGILWDYQAYAINSRNAAGFQKGDVALIENQLAAGDTTTPATPTAIAVRQSGAKQVEIEPTFVEPPDWGTTLLYRNTTNNSATATLVDSGKKKKFHDNNIVYGTTYYYWCKVGDNTYVATGAAANLSGFSPSSSHSITIGKLDTVDYSDISVTKPKRVVTTVLGPAAQTIAAGTDALVAGALPTNSVINFGAYPQNMTQVWSGVGGCQISTYTSDPTTNAFGWLLHNGDTVNNWNLHIVLEYL